MSYEPVDIVKVSWGKYNLSEHPGRILADVNLWRDALLAELERLFEEQAGKPADHDPVARGKAQGKMAAYRYAARLLRGEAVPSQTSNDTEGGET